MAIMFLSSMVIVSTSSSCKRFMLTFSRLFAMFHKSFRILSTSSTPTISNRFVMSFSSMCSITPNRIMPPEVLAKAE